MGRQSRRTQARQARLIPSTRKPVKASRKVLVILAVVALVLVLSTYMVRYL
jgi:hypothetical protein